MCRLVKLFQSLMTIAIVTSSVTVIEQSVRANPVQIDQPDALPAKQLIADSNNQPRRYGTGRAALYKHIDTVSGDDETAFAEHLNKSGVKIYGAYWCPHCFMQKTLFGESAAAKLPYIECAEGGPNARPELCKQQNVHRFPTWEINGKLFVGARDLKDLAQMTGYTGSTNFKYQQH